MIAKGFKGIGFASTLNYVLNREDAHLLDSKGVRAYNLRAMTKDFECQRSLRPGVRNPMAHMVLSWSPDDRDQMDQKMMRHCAREYLDRLGVKDTQYVTVYHDNTEHPHVHVVYNRVDNQGKGVHISREWYNSAQICRQMSEEYGFTRGTNRSQINRTALKGRDQQRISISDELDQALDTAQDWDHLQSLLSAQEIDVFYRMDVETQRPVGVAFGKGKMKFKGTAIGTRFTFNEIDKRIRFNQHSVGCASSDKKRSVPNNESKWCRLRRSSMSCPDRPGFMTNHVRLLNAGCAKNVLAEWEWGCKSPS